MLSLSGRLAALALLALFLQVRPTLALRTGKQASLPLPAARKAHH